MVCRGYKEHALCSIEYVIECIHNYLWRIGPLRLIKQNTNQCGAVRCSLTAPNTQQLNLARSDQFGCTCWLVERVEHFAAQIPLREP